MNNKIIKKMNNEFEKKYFGTMNTILKNYNTFWESKYAYDKYIFNNVFLYTNENTIGIIKTLKELFKKKMSCQYIDKKPYYYLGDSSFGVTFYEPDDILNDKNIFEKCMSTIIENTFSSYNYRNFESNFKHNFTEDEKILNSIRKNYNKTYEMIKYDKTFGKILTRKVFRNLIDSMQIDKHFKLMEPKKKCDIIIKFTFY